MSDRPTIGILGAGKLGVVLAQLAIKAGYTVNITGSGSPEKIRLSMQVLAPGANVMTAHDAALASDIVILALPLGNYRQLLANALADKIVVDAMNYWWEVDGDDPALRTPASSTSELVQAHLSSSRVVKALSHMGYHHLHDETKPPGAANRKAIALAGDSLADIQAISNLINDLGFDPLPIGELAHGRQLEPGQPAFGANLAIEALAELLDV